MTGRQPPPDIVMAAQAAFRLYPKGAPVCVLLAQWADESGWGEHTPPGSNNPFGEKALPWQAHVEAATTEVIRGRLVPANAPFRAFPSIEEAFAFHAEHLATSHWFAAARACLPDVRAFCQALGGGTPARPSYSTSPRYGADLWAVILGSDLTRYDIPCRSVTMTDTRASPLAAPAAPVNAMPTYADQMIVVLLTGGLQLVHGLSPAQVSALAADIASIIGVLYALFAANPTKPSPVTVLMSLLGKVPKAQQAQWNADLLRMRADILAEVEARLNPEIRAKAGILGAPAVSLADKALATAAADASAHLQIT